MKLVIVTGILLCEGKDDKRLCVQASAGNAGATVCSVTEKTESVAAPLALNTVGLLKQASARLGMGPHHAMQVILPHQGAGGYLPLTKQSRQIY